MLPVDQSPSEYAVSLAITGSVLGFCCEPTCLIKRILRPFTQLPRGLCTVPEKSLPSTLMVTFVSARVWPALLGQRFHRGPLRQRVLKEASVSWMLTSSAM